MRGIARRGIGHKGKGGGAPNKSVLKWGGNNNTVNNYMVLANKGNARPEKAIDLINVASPTHVSQMAGPIGCGTNGTTFVLDVNYDVWVWGAQVFKRPLGTGSDETHLKPFMVPRLSSAFLAPKKIIGIASLGNTVNFLLDTGEVLATGGIGSAGVGCPIPNLASSPSQGLGLPSYAQVKAKERLTGVLYLARGAENAMAVRSNGQVYRAGSKDNQNLGGGGAWPYFEHEPEWDFGVGSPNPVSSQIKAISCSAASTMVLLEDGTVRIKSNNVQGDLGNGKLQSDEQAAGKTVAQICAQIIKPDFKNLPNPNEKIVGIAAGEGACYVVFENGEAASWGNNNYGQLGNGTIGGKFPLPAIIPGLTNVKMIVANGDFTAGVGGSAPGPAHAIAVLKNGDMMSWGKAGGVALTLGDGETGSNYFSPHPVWNPEKNAIWATTTNEHTGALIEGGVAPIERIKAIAGDKSVKIELIPLPFDRIDSYDLEWRRAQKEPAAWVKATVEQGTVYHVTAEITNPTAKKAIVTIEIPPSQGMGVIQPGMIIEGEGPTPTRDEETGLLVGTRIEKELAPGVFECNQNTASTGPPLPETNVKLQIGKGAQFKVTLVENEDGSEQYPFSRIKVKQHATGPGVNANISNIYQLFPVTEEWEHSMIAEQNVTTSTRYKVSGLGTEPFHKITGITSPDGPILPASPTPISVEITPAQVAEINDAEGNPPWEFPSNMLEVHAQSNYKHAKPAPTLVYDYTATSEFPFGKCTVTWPESQNEPSYVLEWRKKGGTSAEQDKTALRYEEPKKGDPKFVIALKSLNEEIQIDKLEGDYSGFGGKALWLTRGVYVHPKNMGKEVPIYETTGLIESADPISVAENKPIKMIANAKWEDGVSNELEHGQSLLTVTRKWYRKNPSLSGSKADIQHEIPGAAGFTYQPTALDIGMQITVLEIAENDIGQCWEAARSNPTMQIYA